jgi:hypothetical protein
MYFWPLFSGLFLCGLDFFLTKYLNTNAGILAHPPEIGG